MSQIDPDILLKLSAAVLAALQRDGRLPARLDEEDYEDLLQEGVLAGLLASDGHDPARGSVRTYLSKPIGRAQLKAAWAMASVGITGHHNGVQVYSHCADGMADELDSLQVDDIADEIEAFDFVWHTYYKNNLSDVT
jgi:hypothetical protein